MQNPAHEIYFFDEFRLDLTRGSLFRGDDEIKLRPKSFDVLKYLTKNHGRLVSKDELIETVWLGTAVTDDSLVQCLKDIRRALSDESQQIIRTVPRRGYIFEKDVCDNISAVVYAEETAGIHVVVEEVVEGNSRDVVETIVTRSGSFVAVDSDEVSGRAETWNSVSVGRSLHESIVTSVNLFARHRRPVVLTFVGVILLSGGVALWSGLGRKAAERADQPRSIPFQKAEVKKITNVGNVVDSTISPDGKFVVYTATDGGRESIWLKQIATETARQIVPPTDGRFYGVAFAPDGNYVFYLKAEKDSRNHGIIYRVPTLGGVSDNILTDADSYPAFSPDGRHFAFLRNSEVDQESVLMIADANGTNERRLSARPLNDSYAYPAWSPDGQTIALSAGSMELGDSFREAVAVSVSDGTEKPITTRKWYWVGRMAWLSDSSGLIMSANPQKSHLPLQLWHLSYPEGEAARITNDSLNYTYVSLSADSRTLLVGNTELRNHIWIAPNNDAAQARRITSGLGDYKHIRWTPDGRLAVAAFSGNNIDIWLIDANGHDGRQLTANAGTNWGHEVSSDGRYIVFGSDRAGNFHIWRMNVDGSDQVQLTDEGGEKFIDISPDGKWIVYTGPDWTLRKIPVDGGASEKVTKGYARESSVSPDGKWIVYTTNDGQNDTHFRLALVPFAGGPPVRFFDLPPTANQMQWVRFSPDSRSIVFIDNRDGVGNLWGQPLEGGPPAQITKFTADRIFSYDWSDDGENLAVIRGAWTADLVLLSQK